MCNKCEIFHSKLCKNHRTFVLKKDNEEIFTGFCKEENHQIKLQYFCKNHNSLCCAACISKIKSNGNGNHKDCEIYKIDDIKDEKLNKSKDNIKLLEELSHKLEESVKQLKFLFTKINENKEELKLKIQKIFTKIRNELNNREDELLFEIDEKFSHHFFKEDLIKESEKLPNKIKLSLEIFKLSDKMENSEYKILSLINDCINIENNITKINQINIINETIKLNNDLEIMFFPNESEMIEKIKKFGEICFINKNNGLSKSIISNDINKQNHITSD